MGLILYGIKNCNTVKSAIQWLKDGDVPFDFNDFKSKGVSRSKLTEWCKQVGWKKLINKRGTTWRQLPASVQEKIVDESSSIELMMEKTSVIKRPVLESDGTLVALGFDEMLYKKVMGR